MKKVNLILFLILPVLFFYSPDVTLADDVQDYKDIIKEIEIVEKLGDYVPEDIILLNEAGEEVTLASFYEEGKPILLNLIYFNCPSLCNLILNGVTDAMKDLSWTAGKEYKVLTVSFAPDEGPELAAMKKESYLSVYDRPGAEDGWHFLTGDEDQVRKLADAVGFGYQWSEEAQEYLHGSAIFFLSPEGKVSRYLYGVMYNERDIRNALYDAADGRVGSTLERIALYCFTYDPDSRSYVPYAMNIMKVGGAVVLAGLGLFLGIFWFRERKKNHNDIRLDV